MPDSSNVSPEAEDLAPDQSGDAARRLLAVISDAIDSGDLAITTARDAKDAATAMGILIDKARGC